MASAYRRGRTRSDEARTRSDGAVAVDAINFNSGAWLAIDFSVSVIVLAKVAIRALHSLLEVNVGKMNGFSKTFGIVKRDLLAVSVEPVAFPVVRVDTAIHPAVAMKIDELSSLKLFVEFGRAGLLEEFFITPKPTRSCSLGIAQCCLVAFCFARIFLSRGIHPVAVDLVVPPGHAEIGSKHVRAGMHVAHHALA